MLGNFKSCIYFELHNSGRSRNIFGGGEGGELKVHAHSD